jgi:hypothetical protein
MKVEPPDLALEDVERAGEADDEHDQDPDQA